MIAPTVRDYLNFHHIKYFSILHSPAFTAQEAAASAHISGRNLAKTVILKIDGYLAMVVVPASEKVDLDRVRSAVNADEVRLATEEEFRRMFPDCELGAMPPFGELYGLPVYAAEEIADYREFVCNAGSHSELIDIAYRDFEQLTHPVLI
jgi:Ala-tRNA(Pro) deacylase